MRPLSVLAVQPFLFPYFHVRNNEIYSQRLENIVDIEFVEHLTNCIGVTAPLLERIKTVE